MEWFEATEGARSDTEFVEGSQSCVSAVEEGNKVVKVEGREAFVRVCNCVIHSSACIPSCLLPTACNRCIRLSC